MVFSSLYFIFIFIPAVCIIYYVLKLFFPRKLAVRNVFLLLSSLFFYAWGEPVYIFLMLCSIAVNYLCALWFDKSRHSKPIFIFCVFFNLFFLLLFKYSSFFMRNINLVFHSDFTVPSFALPIGISFYTFQALSYVIDVYRKKTEPQKNILNLALYISLFPQLIAGPIVRYVDIQKEISSRNESLEKFISGLKKFMFGLASKVILANNLALAADKILNLPVSDISGIPCAVMWLSVISYALQIYFDFFGYSLMAAGLGEMFGFTFPRNFNNPYCASSITDFWRRWHITLSSWFRDYVYIPLGGNRVKPLRHVFNILVTWFLTGFWHGENWNFILWGVYYAFFLILEKYLFFRKPLESSFGKITYRVFTLAVILFGWLIFRIENFNQFGVILKKLFVNENNTLFINYVTEHADVSSKFLFLIPAILCSLPLNGILFSKKDKSKTVFLLDTLAAFVLFVLSVLLLVASTYNPFIYFRF